MLVGAGYSRDEVDELARDGAVRTAATYADGLTRPSTFPLECQLAASAANLTLGRPAGHSGQTMPRSRRASISAPA